MSTDSKVDLSRYKTKELASRVAAILSVPDAIRRVFLTAIWTIGLLLVANSLLHAAGNRAWMPWLLSSIYAMVDSVSWLAVVSYTLQLKRRPITCQIRFRTMATKLGWHRGVLKIPLINSVSFFTDSLRPAVHNVLAQVRGADYRLARGRPLTLLDQASCTPTSVSIHSRFGFH